MCYSSKVAGNQHLYTCYSHCSTGGGGREPLGWVFPGRSWLRAWFHTQQTLLQLLGKTSTKHRVSSCLPTGPVTTVRSGRGRDLSLPNRRHQPWGKALCRCVKSSLLPFFLTMAVQGNSGYNTKERDHQPGLPIVLAAPRDTGLVGRGCGWLCPGHPESPPDSLPRDTMR